jgi:hypothetical protein
VNDVPPLHEQKSQLTSSSVASMEKLQAKGSLQIWAEQSEQSKKKTKVKNSRVLLRECKIVDLLIGNNIRVDYDI